jgi:hypothetical protein
MINDEYGLFFSLFFRFFFFSLVWLFPYMVHGLLTLHDTLQCENILLLITLFHVRAVRSMSVDSKRAYLYMRMTVRAARLNYSHDGNISSYKQEEGERRNCSCVHGFWSFLSSNCSCSDPTSGGGLGRVINVRGSKEK